MCLSLESCSEGGYLARDFNLGFCEHGRFLRNKAIYDTTTTYSSLKYNSATMRGHVLIKNTATAQRKVAKYSMVESPDHESVKDSKRR